MANDYQLKISDWTYQINESEALDLDAIALNDDVMHVLKDGIKYHVKVIARDYNNKTYTLSINDTVFKVSIADKYDQQVESMGLSKIVVQALTHLKAPMPGLVLEIFANVGDQIKEGENLLILEAMKMENIIKAPGDVTIKSILISKGEAVEKAQVLIEFE